MSNRSVISFPPSRKQVLTTTKGDPSLAVEISQNRAEHENLPQSHPAQIFGDAVGASGPVTATTHLDTSHEQLARRICETVVHQISCTVLDVFLQKFAELAKRMTASQVEWQTKTLENIQTALRDACPSRTAAPVADVIDVDAVQEAEGRGRSQVKLTDFMRDNWRDDWAAVKIKSYLLKYSLLLKTRVTQIASRFCEL